MELPFTYLAIRKFLFSDIIHQQQYIHLYKSITCFQIPNSHVDAISITAAVPRNDHLNNQANFPTKYLRFGMRVK